MAENRTNVVLSDDQSALTIEGAWTREAVSRLQPQLSSMSPQTQQLAFNGAGISQMDTAGACVLNRLKLRLERVGISITLQGFNNEQKALLEQIQAQGDLPGPAPVPQLGYFSEVGLASVGALVGLQHFLAFIGEIFSVSLLWLRSPSRIRWSSIVYGVETTGNQAILIVALLAFLIGVVLAYQVGAELSQYGASIYVVDLLGVAVLREFGPLLTAIIIAGRTGSSYTAQLGAMKLNEEIDAMHTMGLSPTELLVLPRLSALLIALPLLSVLADAFGILGGMFMSKASLGLSYADFFQRFGKVVEIKNYYMGLVKVPVFAMIIASIGCFQGFEVMGSAESVGRRTTMSVVQSIFIIIVADAGFSVLYTSLGL